MNACKSVTSLIAMLGLAACGTPQVALDQANNGAGLIAQLEVSLTEFRRVETNTENALLASLRDQQVELAGARKQSNPDVRARASAGDTRTDQLVAKMLADADGIAADDAASKEAQKSNEAALASLLQPLPSTKAATTDAQKKLAAMGSELSRADRYAEFRTFYQAIKDNVEANRKKIQDAEAKANAGH